MLYVQNISTAVNSCSIRPVVSIKIGSVKVFPMTFVSFPAICDSGDVHFHRVLKGYKRKIMAVLFLVIPTSNYFLFKIVLQIFAILYGL